MAISWMKDNKAITVLFELTSGVRTEKLFFLLFNQNICCGYSKEPAQWDGSFEHPKNMLKLMGKKIFTVLRLEFVFI